MDEEEHAPALSPVDGTRQCVSKTKLKRKMCDSYMNEKNFLFFLLLLHHLVVSPSFVSPFLFSHQLGFSR